MSLYNKEGWIDFEWIRNLHIAKNFIVAGRGTGKTHGALVSYNITNPENYIFTRRRPDEVDLLTTNELNPFININKMYNTNFGFKHIKKSIYTIHNIDDSGEKPIYSEPANGMFIPLATIGAVRGFGSAAKAFIYDEFIPEEHKIPLKSEGKAVKNAYETISRNRELDGEMPLQMFCMANADSAENDTLFAFGIVEMLERMQRRGINQYIDREKDIAIFNCFDSPISKQKAQTSLYQGTDGNAYNSMALGNRFEDLYDDFVESKPLIEYKPVVNFGDIGIYKHKNKNEYFVSKTKSGNVEQFNVTERDIIRFKRFYNYLWRAYLNKNVKFESVYCRMIFEKGLKLV